MKVKATILVVVLAGAIAITAACAQNTATVERGKTAFVEQGCYGCHMVGKFGTPIGPDLSRVGVRYDAAYLTRWLRNPSSQRPAAHMPRLELTESEIAALAAYLSSLR